MRYLDIKRRDFIELWVEADGKVELLNKGAIALRRRLALPDYMRSQLERQKALGGTLG